MKLRAFSIAEIAITMIIIAIIMFISAPIVANKMKNKSPSDPNHVQYPQNLPPGGSQIPSPHPMMLPEPGQINVGLSNERDRELTAMEERLNQRISAVSGHTQSAGVSDKYVCTVEGKVDSEGNIVAISGTSDADKINQVKNDNKQRFVFVCEYIK